MRDPLLTLCDDLFETVTQLLHAGSGTVATDLCLSGLVPSLRRLGAKVPALGRLADAVEKVARSMPAEARRLLLDLLVLVRQARSALAAAPVPAGKLVPVPPSGPWQTAMSGSEAANLAELLRRPPARGWKTFTAAVKKHGGLDLRLLAPAAPWVAVFLSVRDRWDFKPLPAWAGPLAEELEKGLDLHDPSHAARLDLLTRLAPDRGLPLCRRSLVEDSPAVWVALRHLSKLPDVTDLLPHLVPHLAGRRQVADLASGMVARVGLPALPALLPLIGDADANRWKGALHTLNRMVHADRRNEVWTALRAHVPHLLDSLAAVPDQFVLAQTLALLTELTPGEDVVSQRLLELLRERNEADLHRDAKARKKEPDFFSSAPDDLCRGNLLTYLGEHGVPDESALVVIATRARLEWEEWSYTHALMCLAALSETYPLAMDALLDLFDKRGDRGCKAAYYLGCLRERAVPLLPQLAALVSGRNPALQLAALEALEQMGPLAIPAAAAICAATASRHAEVRRRALRALQALGPGVPEVVPALTAALKDQDAEVRRTAIDQLGELGGEVPGVVAALQVGLQDPDPELGRRSLDRLAGFRGRVPETLPILLEAVKHQWAEMRAGAVQGLRWFGKRAAEVLPALGAALQDRDAGVRRVAAVAIGLLKPHTAAHVRALRPALKDSEEDVCREAATSLGWMRALAAPALPALRKLAEKYPRDKAIRKAVQRVEGS